MATCLVKSLLLHGSKWKMQTHFWYLCLKTFQMTSLGVQSKPCFVTYTFVQQIKNLTRFQDPKWENPFGSVEIEVCECVDSKDTLPICSHSHALALGCEPKANLVTFVPSIQKLWNDKPAYYLVKGFFLTISKARYSGPRFGRVKTWSQNKSNTYLLYSSLWVLLPLAQIY